MKHSRIEKRYWTSTDVRYLAYLVTRPGMFMIDGRDRNQMVSWIFGYEMGRDKRFEFKSNIE